MKLVIDLRKDTREHIKQAAMFALHIIGELQEVPEGTTDAVATAAHREIADQRPEWVAPPPPPPSVLSVTPEQAYIDVARVVDILKSAPPLSAPEPMMAQAINAALPVVYDASGLPWDARIHQTGMKTKKDGTWKIKKNMNQTYVQQVVSELAQYRLKQAHTAAPIASAAPIVAPAPVATTVPPPPSVPPPPPVLVATPQNVPAPSVTAFVPPPPSVGADAAGAASGNGTPAVVTFRQLVDKVTAATRDNRLAATKVIEIVQQHGAPSLQALNSMSNLIPAVSDHIDLALQGLA